MAFELVGKVATWLLLTLLASRSRVFTSLAGRREVWLMGTGHG